MRQSTRFPDCEALDLSAARTNEVRTLLVPFDRPRAPSPPRLRVASRRSWSHAVAGLLRRCPPYGGLLDCPAAIDLLPYQLEPALAVFKHGISRVLIADEVGLGKTVEAGLILGEILHRDHLARALVVCPASIRKQWAQELASLFALPAAEADAAWLRGRSRELPGEINPWSLPGIYLASMDFLKRPEALHPLDQLRWDLLVVDEAHGAGPASDRRAAIHALARRSRVVVLLTATPHSGDDDEFRALCGIGAHDGAGEAIVLFRRTRAMVQPGQDQPRATLIPVQPTTEETAVLRQLDAYTARLWAHGRSPGRGPCQLVATILRKRSLSCPATLALSLRRRLQLLSGLLPLSTQLPLPLDEDDEPQGEDRVDDEVLGADGLGDAEAERQMLEALVRAASSAAETESKLGVLRRLLRRTREPAIVFTEYRDTAEHLRQALAADGRRVLLLHGGLSRTDRGAALRAFGAGEALLVATDAASEGLNLHHACRLVIHFELPWTPSRLQQRRGRVDRIGQARRVHEIALVAKHSSEQLVLAPLIERARASRPFTRTVSAAHLSESRVAAIVFDGLPRAPRSAAAAGSGEAARQPFTTIGLAQDAHDEAARLALLRRLRQPSDRRPARREHAGPMIPVALPSRRHRARGLTIIIDVALASAGGEAVDRTIVPLYLADASLPTAARHSEICRLVRRFLVQHHEMLAAATAALAAQRARAIEPLRSAALARRRARADGLRRELRPAAAELVQAGLFDRRALRAARARARNTESVQQDIEARWSSGAADAFGSPALEPSFEIRAVLCGALR